MLPFPMACARLTPTAPCGRRIRGLLEPPTAPPGRHRLGARASRPHPVPLAAAELQCGAAGSHPVGGNSIGQAEAEPWRRSRLIQVGEMAEAVPGLVRAGRPRSQEAIIGAGGTPALPGSHHCAGGTPALPGSHHPMTSSHQGHKSAEAFWCCLWLKEVHLSSCLFVFIRGSSSLTIGRFSSNDPHGRVGLRLNTTLTPCTLLKSATR